MSNRAALLALIGAWYFILGLLALSLAGLAVFGTMYVATGQPAYAAAGAVCGGSAIAWALLGIPAQRWARA